MNSKKRSVILLVVMLFVCAFAVGITTKLLKVDSPLVGYIYYICLFCVITYVVKVKEKKSLKSIGVNFENIFVQVALGICIFVSLLLFLVVYYLLGSKTSFVNLGLVQTLVNIIYSICFIGFTEELIFRGYLLGRLNELLNSRAKAIIISSVIFALWHFPANFYWQQVIFAFFFGIVISIIKFRIKENTIIPLAIGHGLYNSFIFIVGYLIK